MAVIDFPTSPSVNDIYTWSGRKWKWNGEGWQAYSSSLALADAATSITIASIDGNGGASTIYPVFVTSNATGTQSTHIDSAGISYNASTNTLTLPTLSVTTISGATNISATTFTGALSGNATSATSVTVASTDGNTSDTTLYPLFVPNASTGTQNPHVDSAFVYNASTDTLTATGLAAATHTVNTSAGVATATITTTTGTTSATSSFDTTVYSSAEFIIYGSTSTGKYVSKVMMLASGSTTPVIDEYSILTIGTAPTVTITPSYSAPNAVLTVAVTSGTAIRIVRTAVVI